MFIKYTRFLLILLFISSVAYAQQTAGFTLNQAYKTGVELFDAGKYAAASEQFGLVREMHLNPSSKKENAGNISLLEENAQYYQAICAQKLGNQDSEQLFLKFIADYPSSAATELVYYYVGNSYFDKKDYPKSIEWFKKINPNSLSANENSNYRYMLAYSYFVLKDYNSSEPLFAKLKDEKTDHQETSIYYYAYLNYLDADYKTALTEFERLRGSKTYEASYPYYISALYFLDKRYDDVILYTVSALKTIDDKYKTEMYRIVGASYFAKQDYQNAITYYQNFQQRDQRQTQNNQDNYQIGYTNFKLKNYPAAIVEFEKMTEPDLFYQNAMISLGESFIRTNNKQGARNAFFRASKLSFDKQLQEEGAFNYAKLSYELEFHQVALDAIKEFMKTYPASAKTADAKVLLGEVLLSTKAYQDAVDIMESIPNRTGEARAIYQRVTYYRALQFYNERAFENSISMFMRSINSASEPKITALGTYWLAEALFEVRKYGESVMQFEKFLNLPGAKETDVLNYANYALAYAAFQFEKYDKSATYFARFLRGNEKDQNTVNDAILRLADSYFVLKNYELAMAQYNKIITSGVKGEDYALFQRGMIQGLQKQNEIKISTMQSLISQYPNSNYADDAGFEIGYTYFLLENFERAKGDLTGLIAKYPRSSYVPRALNTIGLVERNQKDDDAALTTFKRVVAEYKTTEEAKEALENIKNIYMDKTDAQGFLEYANTTGIGNLSTSDQDAYMFQAANTRFLRGEYQGAFEGVNAYFDKFPKPINDKHAKFIRAESLVKLKRPNEAIADYNDILNDWTSPYTERALISISQLYLDQKKYNDAVVFLKRLETNAEYKSHYNFAISNLLKAYSEMQMPNDVFKYVLITNNYEKSSQDEKQKAQLYGAKAYLMTTDTSTAIKEFTDLAAKTKTATGAEAKYNLALLQYLKGNFKLSQATAMDLGKNFSDDYWVTKSYILLADDYVGLKDEFQAKATLQSVIDNYEGNDDILPTAKEKLQKLNSKK